MDDETTFPFLRIDQIETQQLVRKHGLDVPPYGVPFYWQVNDGQYDHVDSWTGLRIPKEWLFAKHDTESSETIDKMLILEADVASGESRSFSLTHPKEAQDLRLDLYEVAQGFYRLRQQVVDDAPHHDVLRVLLVDADAIVRSGGGRIQTAREYVNGLGLADVVVDARGPLLYCIENWLHGRTWKPQTLVNFGLFRWNTSHSKEPVVLEPPCAICFESMKAALGDLGYNVMGISEATKPYGSVDFPVFVYERTTQDTIHTIRRFVSQQAVNADNVCALCPTQHGLVELDIGQESPIATICSSDVYDHLFRYVSQLATERHPYEAIQGKLDDNLGEVLFSKSNPAKPRLGFPTS